MSAAAVILVAVSTLAFGAVYPWGYVPLFCAAASIGLIGVVRFRNPPLLVSFALLSVGISIGVQLVPLPLAALDAVSPRMPAVLSTLSLVYGSESAHAISIAPSATGLALAAFSSLSLYFLGLAGALSTNALRALPAALTTFAVPLSLFGIVSREWANGLIYWFWKPVEGGGANGFGPFVNRNHFAGWMLMALCLALGWLLGHVERESRRLGVRPRFSQLISSDAPRLVAAASSVAVMAIALVWTMSRSAIVGLVVAISLFAWVVFTRTNLERSTRLAGVALVMLILFAGIAWRGPTAVVQWFADTRDLNGRFAAWQDGWRVVQDFKLAGTGLNTYGIAMLFYQESNPGFHLGSAHNDYLQLLAEGGVLVAIPAVFAVGALAYSIKRNLMTVRNESRGFWIRSGAAVSLVAIAVQEVVEFSLQIPANALLCCTLAAIALAPPMLDQTQRSQPSQITPTTTPVAPR